MVKILSLGLFIDHQIVGTNVRNDLQRPTTTYNDPTMTYNDPTTTLQRSTTTYNDATTTLQ